MTKERGGYSEGKKRVREREERRKKFGVKWSG